MRFAHTPPEAAPPRRRGGVLAATLRLGVVAYWTLGIGLGLVHLKTQGFSQEAWGETLTIWYAEALIFLAIFGGGALLAGIVTRGPGRARLSRLSDPLKTSTLAAVERNRGH